MTSTLLAISAAYVVVCLLLLTLGLSSRFAWWVKATVIVVTSLFFVEVFFATKGLLGWPRAGQLPARFQLLWVRVVEPDLKNANPGAIYLWIEEVDENNVPDGVPRSYRLPYSRPLADRTAKARDEIMSGKPQQGLADDLGGTEKQQEAKSDDERPGSRVDPGLTTVDQDQFRLLQQAQRWSSAPCRCRHCRPSSKSVGRSFRILCRRAATRHVAKRLPDACARRSRRVRPGSYPPAPSRDAAR
jgi:hypothetical protein